MRADGGRAHQAGTGAAVRAGCGALAAGEQLVEDGHAHDDAGLDLLADHGLRRVDHLGGELDAAVDRAGVHEHLARAQAAAVDLVLRGVLAQRRDEAVGHALVLHPQRVDDVGLGEVVERVGDVERAPPSRAGSASAGRTTVTFAPILVKARMFERATRLCRTSPTIQMFSAVEAAERARAACRRPAAPASGARACRRRR